MILYCDTSALVKRYVVEEGTELVDRYWEDAFAISTSVVAFAEALSVFNRKRREKVLSGKEYSGIVRKFKNDYRKMVLIPVSERINEIVERLLKTYPLRGFDAIHLASAVLLKEETKIEEITFACFDRTLNLCASREGLKVAGEGK